MTVQLFEVGGCVRDELLGLTTKDVDYTVIAASYEEMYSYLRRAGFEIFLLSPEYFTIRARFPRENAFFGGRLVTGLTADFVLARKEGKYTDGRRPDVVEMGTLLDDLQRRDFTVNAMAKDISGRVIDPFNGRQDLEAMVLKAVGDPEDRLREDALRALRAVRFAVTKGFSWNVDLSDALRSEWLPGLLASVSAERRREELLKAFKADTLATFNLLQLLGAPFREAVFADGLKLKPTLGA